jgi:hypothetical protein
MVFGIADKAPFFRQDHASSRQSSGSSGMPPLRQTPERNHQNSDFFRMESAGSFGSGHGIGNMSVPTVASVDVTMQKSSSASVDMSMQKSSSASVDTRDSLRDIAKRVAPVNRDGVEFAPLDENFV